MPLQNRVTPFGDLSAAPARGTFMGNRGGRFHTDARTLTARRWASRQWICCVLDFKRRQRDVWGRYYTELFFLDEPTALAAGHRPCFECRRKEAQVFAARWQQASGFPRRPKRARWMTCCTPSVCRGAPSVCIGATSTRCRMAPSSRWRTGLSRCAAMRCCAGRRKVTTGTASAARHHGRCAHAAGNSRGLVGRLSATLASERGELTEGQRAAINGR